jgi:hypothetical protein
MLDRVSTAGVAAATKPIAQTGNDSKSTAQAGSEPHPWLKNAAKTLLPPDAGLHLHYITDYPERTCYRYASGEREAPGDFLRALFHSQHGEPFFMAFMEGCEADWWREFLRHRRMGAGADKES